MGMGQEFDTPDPRFTALYIGTVVDNNDPEKLGRVRIRIPGLIDPGSAFAFPLGTVGGGSAQRGFFNPPDVGAEVGVLFNQGDVDHPYYLCGHWGKPGGQSEVPSAVADATPEEAHDVKSFETRRWAMTFDDRPGRELLRIEDKKTGDNIEFDGVSFGITIQATSALLLRAVGIVEIQGASVVINGRTIVPSPKPI